MKSLKKCFEEAFGELRRLASNAGEPPAILRRIINMAPEDGEFRRRSPKTSSRTFSEHSN